MALAIILVTSEDIPHQEDQSSVLFGFIDPLGWESLFFDDMQVMNYLAYTGQGHTASSYDDYYADRIFEIGIKYPLIVRARDYYKDATFSKDEIAALIQELQSLKNLVKQSDSKVFLDQLSKACEVAKTNCSGILLSAD